MSEEQTEQIDSKLEDIMKLGSGKELDNAFVIRVLKREPKKREPAYSASLGDVAQAVLDHTDIPIQFGRSAIGDPYYDAERVFWAGHPQYAVVRANSAALATIKAAIVLHDMIEAQKASLFGKTATGIPAADVPEANADDQASAE